MKRLTRWFLRLITGRDMLAVTVAQRVFLLYSPGELIDRLGPAGYARLWRHENEHVRQQKADGWRFYWNYFSEFMKYGYENVSYEVLAREAEEP